MNKKGVSIIEIIVYMAMLSIITAAVGTIMISTNNTNKSLYYNNYVLIPLYEELDSLTTYVTNNANSSIYNTSIQIYDNSFSINKTRFVDNTVETITRDIIFKDDTIINDLSEQLINDNVKIELSNITCNVLKSNNINDNCEDITNLSIKDSSIVLIFDFIIKSNNYENKLITYKIII